MQSFDAVAPMRSWCNEINRRGESLAIVPTMGALHQGHLSLVRQAKRENDRCVVTIYVNPTQFGAGEDLDRYPRTLENDLRLLQSEHVDAVFLPDDRIMYPSGYGTYVQPPPVANQLEGASRPTHFRGVLTIVLKLFQIIPAQVGYFGRKDYQQLCVISQMARDFNLPIRVVGCEIVRESDGLAMSSRNRYLSDSERQRALVLSAALNDVSLRFRHGQHNVHALATFLRERLNSCEQLEYAEIRDAVTLEPIEEVKRDAVALVAARFGETRLIDNVLLLP